MLVTLLLLLLPLFAADESLLFVDELLCVWLALPPAPPWAVLVFLFEEFPELLTPELEVDDPPVAVEDDPADALALLFAVLVAIVLVGLGSVGIFWHWKSKSPVE